VPRRVSNGSFIHVHNSWQVAEHIERAYNRQRLHQAFGDRSPEGLEKMAGAFPTHVSIIRWPPQSSNSRSLSGVKILVQHPYPGQFRNQGVAQSPVPTIEPHGTRGVESHVGPQGRVSWPSDRRLNNSRLGRKTSAWNFLPPSTSFSIAALPNVVDPAGLPFQK
jgi:hypothetical protein